jgi:sugar phosphate isomerase/epimerase
MRVCINTGSCRYPNIISTLEVLSVLGMRDLELHLRPVLDGNISPEPILAAIGENDLCVRTIAGGWCDFFSTGAALDETFRTVERQVELADFFSCDRIRLFFGRLPRRYFDNYQQERLLRNVAKISDTFTETTFVFENYQQLNVEIDFLDNFFWALNRKNIRFNFDAINFELQDVDSNSAILKLQRWLAHVHVKGMSAGKISAYRDSEYDFLPIFRFLKESNYSGEISLEFEAGGDVLLNLYDDYQKLVDDIKTVSDEFDANKEFTHHC